MCSTLGSEQGVGTWEVEKKGKVHLLKPQYPLPLYIHRLSRQTTFVLLLTVRLK